MIGAGHNQETRTMRRRGSILGEPIEGMHEAGHAIIEILGGRTPERLELARRGCGLDQISPRSMPEYVLAAHRSHVDARAPGENGDKDSSSAVAKRRWDGVAVAIRCLLAGLLAGRGQGGRLWEPDGWALPMYAAGPQNPGIVEAAGGTDPDKVGRILLEVLGSRLDELFASTMSEEWARTKQILRSVWPAVERIGVALRKHRRIEGDALDRLAGRLPTRARALIVATPKWATKLDRPPGT